MLYGNNPRIPWKPSTTMLDNRLTGTRDARRLTATNPPSVIRNHRPNQPPADRTRPRIFAHHGAPKAPPSSTALLSGCTEDGANPGPISARIDAREATEQDPILLCHSGRDHVRSASRLRVTGGGKQYLEESTGGASRQELFSAAPIGGTGGSTVGQPLLGQ